MPALAMAEAAASTIRSETQQTIEVRSLSLHSVKHQTERLSRYLSPDEFERASRFHFQADHDRYVAARAVLRLQIGAILNRDPRTLLFEYTSYGKPYIADSGIEFNLSQVIGTIQHPHVIVLIHGQPRDSSHLPFVRQGFGPL